MKVERRTDCANCGQDRVTVTLTVAEAQDLSLELPSTGRMVVRLAARLKSVTVPK